MNLAKISAGDFRQVSVVLPGINRRLPGEIEAGLFQQRVHDLLPNLICQVIDMRLKLVTSHTDQHNGLTLEPRVSAELQHQVRDKGVIQPGIKRGHIRPWHTIATHEIM